MFMHGAPNCCQPTAFSPLHICFAVSAPGSDFQRARRTKKALEKSKTLLDLVIKAVDGT